MLDNLVCIITGANSLTGIGRAAVYAFAKKNARAIYATDISEENLASLAEDVYKTTGVECIPKRMDASSDHDIQAVIGDAMARFGRLDVYFANAGIAGPHPMKTETQDEFLNMMRVNAWSVYAAIKYASEAMKKTCEGKPTSSGSIIATASVAGVRSGAGPMSYSASKAAVINLCQSAAWRLRGTNIRVNAICPGLIVTEMTEKVLAAIKGNGTMESTLTTSSALQRFGDPKEIAAMAAFLAGPEASFITGQDVKVDGGMTASLPYAPLFADD
ncbi:hypothetical protein FB192DRAFT_1442975 [Mucor lusitanicus]|uniref:Glucose 1-dehydrogenase n=1 Tax=Mucor circinelloides f. lusitanicus TaxID=29924 RepID=A0A8H4BUC1_MUCCL|nr:hypothetical protein FB192DRAFT_1442975 [Mucor lusitanicus]